MTPLQKGSIVQLVHLGLAESDHYGGAPVTAAVGDGGNDVSMILQANVGIGVFGKEGQEAVRAADYAIAQFRLVYVTTILKLDSCRTSSDDGCYLQDS